MKVKSIAECSNTFDRYKSCIVCNFWSFNFRTNVSIFQEHSKKTKIQVYILSIS